MRLNTYLHQMVYLCWEKHRRKLHNMKKKNYISYRMDKMKYTMTSLSAFKYDMYYSRII